MTLILQMVALAVVLAPLNGCGRYWVCEPADPERVAELPRSLSETGLYADIATGELAMGVLAYTPRFALWSDGADIDVVLGTFVTFADERIAAGGQR